MLPKSIPHRILLLIPIYYAANSIYSAIRISQIDNLQAPGQAGALVAPIVLTLIAPKWIKKILNSPYKWGFWSGFVQAPIVLIQFVLWKLALNDPRKSHLVDPSILHLILYWIPHVAFIASAVILKSHWLKQRREQRALAKNG